MNKGMPQQRRVVVTGLGVVTSIGHDVASFWSALVAGKIGVHRVTHFDPSDFACQIGAEVRNWDVNQFMDPKEARRNDRYTHFGFVAAKQAVADSGIDMAKEDGDRVGSSSAPVSAGCLRTRPSSGTSSSGARGRSPPSRSRPSSGTCARAWWRSNSAPAAPTSGWSRPAPRAPTPSARRLTRSAGATRTSWSPAGARRRSRPLRTPRSAR